MTTPVPTPSVPLRRGRATVLATAAAALMIAAAPAMAQMPGPGGKGPMGHHGAPHGWAAPAMIEVTGNGTASVEPDMAAVTVGVTVQAPTAGEAMSQNATRQQAVIDALTGRGIEARDIQTSNLSLSPVQDYSREGQPPVITGYQAGNMVTVRVRDLPQLGPVLDAIVAAGANEIQGVNFQRDDAAGVEAEARRDAVANARERAEVIADAAGQRLGRLVSISAGSFSGPPVPMMAMAPAPAREAKIPVQTGELSVTADVTARWELLPMDGGPADDGTPLPMDDNAPVPAAPASPAPTPSGIPPLAD